MRVLFAAFAIVAFATIPAYAISVDGDISDWAAGQFVCHGPIVFNANASYKIATYGAVVADNNSGVPTFYAYVELQNPVGISAEAGGNPAGHAYFGAWIDTDNSTTTSLSGGLPAGTTGADIEPELDFDTGAIPTGGGPGGAAVNIWGHGNDVGNGCIASPGATFAHNAAQTIFEFSVPVSEIVNELPNGSGASAGNPHAWKIYVGGECGTANGYSSGREIGLVPEPGTIAMLIGAGVALLGYALRRRS